MEEKASIGPIRSSSEKVCDNVKARNGQTRKLSVFDTVHPALQLGCFGAILVFTMMAIQPVLLAFSFIAALSFGAYTRGWLATLKTLAWQLPLIALCAAINPLFSMVGFTELFRIGSSAIYVESVAFGACMGMMLASIMLWFYNASQVLTSDKVLAVLGNVAPTIGLMVSMALRLVPQFVKRGRLIGSTVLATSSAKPRNAAEKTATHVRLISVLMGWSMEDSLETADAMRARAWGAAHKRTTYQRYRFYTFDMVASVSFALLVFINAFLAWAACSQYHFYPTMSNLIMWWGYVPYALFMFLPLLICLIDDMRWRQIS